jgi:hypothetical protein
MHPGLAAVVLTASPSPSPSPSAHGGIEWGDVPAWVAAIATVIGLTAAITGAVIAFRQFRLQTAILNGEVERNKRRDELLDGQLKELLERANDRAREQAEQIYPVWYNGQVSVRNHSSRPITSLAIRVAITDDHGGHTTYHASGWHEGRDISDGKRSSGDIVDGAVLPVLRPGHQAESLWASSAHTPTRTTPSGKEMPKLVRMVTVSRPPDLQLLRFNDDAGRRWQLDEYQHLERAPEDDGW